MNRFPTSREPFDLEVIALEALVIAMRIRCGVIDTETAAKELLELADNQGRK